MLQRFLHELRRRRVPQVAGFYLAAGWIMFEVSEAALPRLGLPDWTVTFVLVLLLLAFPLVIGVAWLYNVTPDGVRRTPSAGAEASARPEHAAPAPGAPAISAANGAFGKIAVTSAVLVLALAGGAFILFDRGGPDVELAPDAMVVLPFTVRGGDDVDVLAEGMVELLSAKLDGVGELRSADPHAVLSRAAGGVDAAGARDLARRLGAGHYVLGSVLEFGGDLRLQASIYRTDGGAEPIADAAVEGPTTSFLALVDDLAAELLVAGDLAPPGRIPRIAAMTTEDLGALRFFLEGERALRETRYDNAIDRFERAAEADTAFALAYYRMSVAASWAERPSLLDRAIAAAQRHQDRLSDRDRALLAAFAARHQGRHAEAERRYRAIVASHPEDLEAWYELGEVVLHRGAFLGVPVAETGRPFERTLELDPGHGGALYHLSNVVAWTGDVPRLDSITRVFREELGGEAPLDIEAQWAFAVGDSVDRARVLEQMVGASGVSAFFFAALAAPSVREVRRVMDAAEALDPPPFLIEYLGEALVRFGRRDDALDWLARMESAPGPPVRTASLATNPFLRTPPDRLRRLRDRLETWDPGPVRTDPVGPGLEQRLEPVHPQVRLYLLALIEARLDRPGEAIRLTDELEAMGGSPAVGTLAADLARHVRAQIHFDQGRAGEALRILEGSAFWEATAWDERFSSVLSRAGPVLLRAEALQELGRDREAIRWYSSVVRGPEWAFGLYRQAQSYEALGEPAAAAERYARFVELWADADPDLQDLVRDARRRLEALAAEG